MSASGPLNVVLCWHMHQPQYREPTRGEYVLPWTYLHAIKDYTDMVAHLEANEQARAVVNFVPVLIEQIDDYAAQLRAHLDHGGAIRDPLLAALAEPALPGAPGQRLVLIEACLRANRRRVIDRFRPFQRLANLAASVESDPAASGYLSDQFLADLLVWFHLGWLGETVHLADPRIQGLVKKGSGFTFHDRCELLHVISELLDGVLDRYRVLAEAGRIELSFTPFAHPILPLLIDLRAGTEAAQLPVPGTGVYPGGAERAHWHLLRGATTFEERLGVHPAGCWPSEGALSTAACEAMAEFGIRWAASGEGVLANSLRHANQMPAERKDWLYRPWRIGKGGLPCFFRDDGLSDLIGFTYSEWHADDAVADLVNHLEQIAASVDDPASSVVSIVLDGENAWEHYPENGYHFLRALYARIAASKRLELTTFSRFLARGDALPPLQDLVAGSWVYGNLATWVGDADKNRAWELLVNAKTAFDDAVASGRLHGEALAAATEQLAVCEGSDWFWWFGDYNPAQTVSDFEQLYRAQLAALYRLVGVEPPEALSHTLSVGRGAPQHGGTMRPGAA